LQTIISNDKKLMILPKPPSGGLGVCDGRQSGGAFAFALNLLWLLSFFKKKKVTRLFKGKLLIFFASLIKAKELSREKVE